MKNTCLNCRECKTCRITDVTDWKCDYHTKENASIDRGRIPDFVVDYISNQSVRIKNLSMLAEMQYNGYITVKP